MGLEPLPDNVQISRPSFLKSNAVRIKKALLARFGVQAMPDGSFDCAEDIDAAFSSYLMCNLYFLCRDHPTLMHDLFVRGAADMLTPDEGHSLCWGFVQNQGAMHSWCTPELAFDDGPVWELEETVGFAQFMLVREQLMLGIQMNNFADDPESSALYPQYAAALPTMSRWQREAVLLLCGTDLGLSRRKLFLVLLGPSTIPGAGIGALALGTVPDLRYHYWGRRYEQASAHLAHPDYRVQCGDDVIDGSIAASTAACMNGAETAEEADGRFEVVRGQVVVRVRKAVCSRELLVWYGHPGSGHRMSGAR